MAQGHTQALDDTRSIRHAFLSALRPPPDVTVTQWAERFRRLPTETAADAGRWDNELTPYLREVMDVLSPSHPTQRVVFQGSSRIGKTEALNNTVGCYMDVVHCPIMAVQPVEGDAEEWSKDHLDPMIENTPRLRELVTPDSARRKGNTILHKRYRGGIVYMVGANSPKSFRRRTVRLLVCDEVDAYPGSLQGEGDPLSLAEERTATFPFSKKVLFASTPTIKDDSRIEKAFNESDQRYYLVPCPECGHRQRLVWSQVKWSEERVDASGAIVPAKMDDQGYPVAEYLCVACGCFIPHYKKTGMLALGTWQATRASKTVGFHVSALYSPWVSWGQLADEWLKKHKDPAQLQTFVNTKLGETWDLASSEQWDSGGLMDLVEPVPFVPGGVAVITASIDVQADRLVLQVDAWGAHEERWTLERRDLLGDPSVDPNAEGSVWGEADLALLSRYPFEGGGSVGIKAACVDTGGHHTQQAYKFCRAGKRRRVWPIKGMGGEGKRLWPESARRKKNKGRDAPFMLGVDSGKETCHGRLKRSLQTRKQGLRGGPGYWHFAACEAIGPAYFEELTAEVCVFRYSGAAKGEHASKKRRQWVLRDKDARNEALDCSVYSYAALQGLLAGGSVNLDKPLVPSAEPATVSIGRGGRRSTPTEIVISNSPRNLPKLQEMAAPGPATPMVQAQAPARKPKKKAAAWF